MLRGVRKTIPLDPRVLDVVEVWRANGVSDHVIGFYLGIVRAFIEDCRGRGVQPDGELRRDAVIRFANRRAKKRGCKAYGYRRSAYSALRRWACGLAAGGASIPPWEPPVLSQTSCPILHEFADYRRLRCGIAGTTIKAEI